MNAEPGSAANRVNVGTVVRVLAERLKRNMLMLDHCKGRRHNAELMYKWRTAELWRVAEECGLLDEVKTYLDALHKEVEIFGYMQV